MNNKKTVNFTPVFFLQLFVISNAALYDSDKLSWTLNAETFNDKYVSIYNDFVKQCNREARGECADGKPLASSYNDDPNKQAKCFADTEAESKKLFDGDTQKTIADFKAANNMEEFVLGIQQTMRDECAQLRNFSRSHSPYITSVTSK